jgi:hypothetical protein
MVWIAASLLFCAQLYFVYNVEVAVNFLTGYVIEESLSLDNLFVILLTFESFRIQKADQHKVLFWGILSAIILRGACIFAGLALIQRFEWMLQMFGVLLLVAVFRILTEEEDTHGALLSAPAHVVSAFCCWSTLLADLTTCACMLSAASRRRRRVQRCRRRRLADEKRLFQGHGVQWSAATHDQGICPCLGGRAARAVLREGARCDLAACSALVLFANLFRFHTPTQTALWILRT